MKYLQYQIIKSCHNIFKNINIKVLSYLSIPIGFIYYLLTFKNSMKLHKRSKRLNKKLTIKYIKNLKNEGIIFALPHVGNWEMAIPVGKSINLDLIAVAEPLSNHYVLNWFKDLREKLGCRIIIGGKGQNTFNTIINELNSGKHICLLSERSINKTGVGVEFFNNLASFPKGPVALALKTQLPIVPTTFLKINNKYSLVFEKPFYVPLFDNEAISIQQGLKTLAISFEKLISLNPNEWHSIQPVWSHEY